MPCCQSNNLATLDILFQTFERNGQFNVKCNTIEAGVDSTDTVGFGGNNGKGVNGCPKG
jgi:hypothetical protein